MKGQLTEASSATSKAYCVYRREMDPEIDMVCPGPEAGSAEEKSAEEVTMSPAITIMRPILRFLQLLCENHNRELQVRPLLPVGGRCSLGRAIQVKLICNLGGNFEEIINKDSNVPLKWKGRKTRGKNVCALKNKTNKSTHCYPVIQDSHLSTAEPHLLSFTVFVQEDHLYLICLSWF